MSSSWTDERMGVLKALWVKGVSASEIARQLGGVTHNAVIGKAHRMGLKAHSTAVKALNHKDAVKGRGIKSGPDAWDTQRHTLLRKHWPDPLMSAALIAALINEATPEGKVLTKMAVIARAGRLGLGPKPVDDGWAAEEMKLLTELWSDGALPTSEIARRVGKPWGRTSVKAAALGLGPRPVRTSSAADQLGHEQAERMAEKRRAAIAAIATSPTRYDHLRGLQCQFPIADPPAGEGMDRMMCCGSPRPAGRPYCHGHQALAHTTPPVGKPRTGNELARSLRRYV